MLVNFMKPLGFSILKFQENLNGTTTYSASCQEYFEQGDQRNGTYFIRPSLARKELLNISFKINRSKFIFHKSHAFQVQCLFTEGSARTLIQPLNWPSEGYIFPENATTRCVEPNCFSRNIEYGPSREQIKV